MDEPRRDLPGLALVLFRFERIDEVNGGEEPDALSVMLDGLDTDRRGEMRLAGAGPANQDGVVGVLQELTAVKLANESFIDLAASEVEAGEVTIVWKARGLELSIEPPGPPSLPSKAGTGSAARPRKPESLARSVRRRLAPCRAFLGCAA
jgi:hypothetical protein